MRKSFAVLLLFSIAAHGLLFATAARAANGSATPASAESQTLFSPQQLDNLVASVALYPDPLLAQVMVAATFPDQIDEAARFLRAGANPGAIDTQPWDVSVKSVAHYPTVLYMMADNLDWTTSLGQAYVYQSTDVMAAVQRLRTRARARGYLVTTPQMEVVVDSGYISLWPVQPRLLYVPVYDPALVFYGYPGYRVGPVISFGMGFAIGAWLIYDFDWHHHHVYYHGWAPRRGWVNHYRRHIHRRNRNIYVSKRYAHVRVNRRVVDRRVNYHTLKRYNDVHRQVHYDDVYRRQSHLHRRVIRSERRVPGKRYDVRNKVIRRNFNPNDPRIDTNRGRLSERRPRQVVPPRRVTPPRQVVRPTPQRRQPTPRREVRPAPRQRQTTPRAVRPAPRQRQTTPRVVRPEPRQRQTTPRVIRPAPRRRQTTPRVIRRPSRQPRQQIRQREDSVFRGGRRGIDPRAARQRGEVSRRQMQRSRPAARSRGQRRQVPSRR